MKQTIIALFTLMLIGKNTTAQVSVDSMKNLKTQKDILKIQERLNANKIELAKYENSIAGTSRNQEIAAKDAQQSANANNNAASDLSNDAQNRKLAKKASRKARQAEKDASTARKNNGRMDKLNKNIEGLKKKIAEDEQKLLLMGIMPTHNGDAKPRN
jgi:hypothetical protein